MPPDRTSDAPSAAAAGSDEDRLDDPTRPPSFAVILRVLAALVWILWGLKLYQPTFVVSGAPESGLIFTVGGVIALVVVALRPTGKSARTLDAILLVATLVAIALWTRAAVFGSPAYGTDEVAFDQGAAQLLLQGRNPYGVDLSWTFDAFRVLPSGTTNTLAGGFVHTLSYPAGAFLVYVPLLAIGVVGQAAIYVNTLFWIIGLCVLWSRLPPRFRPIVPVLGSLGIYIDYATGGVTDSLMMPFIVLALWRWDRFGDETEDSIARWVGPIALGLACTFKQSAWFIVPMLVAGVTVESLSARRGWSPTYRYLGLFAAAFAVPNLPFILLDPRAWIGGVFLPFLEPLVPFGQGFVAFSTTFFQGGGFLPAYTAAGAAAMAALVLAFVVWYGRLKPLAAVLPLVALLLPTRSLNSYFVYAIPGVLVAIATTRPPPARHWPSFRRVRVIGRSAAVALGSAALVALAIAVLTPAPLLLRPLEQHTTGQLQTVDSLTVDAENTTDEPITPHFALALGAYMSSFWVVNEGPPEIAPHTTARYVLVAPNAASMPSVTQESVLFALSNHPATISSARLFAATPDRTEITPQAVNRIVRDPPEVTFDVAVVDKLNNPIPQAGVAVSLGQVVYSSEGLFPGLASINGKPEGQSPVVALTDASGVAHFTARAIQQQPHEIFFQAWLQEPFPHGYSGLVSVHFEVPPS